MIFINYYYYYYYYYYYVTTHLFFYSSQKFVIHQLLVFPFNLQGPEKTLVLKSCFIIKN